MNRTEDEHKTFNRKQFAENLKQYVEMLLTGLQENQKRPVCRSSLVLFVEPELFAELGISLKRMK